MFTFVKGHAAVHENRVAYLLVKTAKGTIDVSLNICLTLLPSFTLNFSSLIFIKKTETRNDS